MKTSRRLLVSVLVLVLTATGCATVNTMKAASDSTGRTITFSAPYPQVFSASVTALQNLGFQLNDYSEAGHHIYGKHGMSAFSWGEVAGLRFKEIGETSTQVQIINERVLATNIFAPDWTEQIRTQIFMELEQMKARQAAAAQSSGDGGKANN